MTFGTLIAEALQAGLPIALVDIDSGGADLTESIAELLGRTVVRIDVATIGDPSGAMAHRGSTRPHVLIVEGCSRIQASDEAIHEGRTPEDVLLDLAFDGDPSLPDDCAIVLCFDEPTHLSDALAEDTIPCTVLSPDMGEADKGMRSTIMTRVAEELGVPIIDVPLSTSTTLADFAGLPDAA